MVVQALKETVVMKLSYEQVVNELLVHISYSYGHSAAPYAFMKTRDTS